MGPHKNGALGHALFGPCVNTSLGFGNPEGKTCIHRRWNGGQWGHWPPWNLKFLAKKVVFLVLSGKKNFTPFGPPLKKILKNPLVPPLEKHFTIVQVNGCIN